MSHHVPKTKFFEKRHPPVGARPGTLVVPEGAARPHITVFDYTIDGVVETEIEHVADVTPYLDRDSVTWVNVEGLGDEAMLREIATLFNLHPLLIEDVVNAPQRPKVEPYGDLLLLITRMVTIGDHDAASVEAEQVSIILGKRYVLTFQERQGNVFDPLRARIHRGLGAIRRSGTDYLAYAILDTVIDAYYPALEQIGEYLETLETEVVESPTNATVGRIYDLKRQLLTIRRAVWPQRDMINRMVHEEEAFSEPVRVYLRDCYDHCVQAGDIIESYREMAGGLLDVYLSSVSNRTNEVMKVLTIMASIFIPLTFIAGVYGMNFEFMPELHHRLAYPILLTVMVVMAVAMVWYFQRRGWISGRKHRDADRPH
jgi:magnesium transporter